MIRRRDLLVGAGTSIQDLPPGGPDLAPALPWLLAPRYGQTTATAVSERQFAEIEVRDVEVSWDEGAHRPGHFLLADRYDPRRFFEARLSNLAMTINAKALLAHPGGLVDELSIGGLRHFPHDLIGTNLTATPDGWRTRARNIERVPGVSIPFCHYGLEAFGHFVLDGLLQLYLFRDPVAAGEAKVAHWPLSRPWMGPLLDLCGAPPARRRELKKPVALFQEALTSSALAGHGVYFPADYSRDFFAWLAEKFDADPGQENGRVYVRRDPNHPRRVLNQPDVEALAARHGFQILDPAETSVAEQGRMIAQAEVMMTAWGSSLTLAPLLGGRRTIIELTPATVTDAWFVRQAAVHGLAYRPLLHAATGEGDIVADLDRIKAALNAL